jgi:hypothetical protein
MWVLACHALASDEAKGSSGSQRFCTFREYTTEITGLEKIFFGDESQHIADWYPEMCSLDVQESKMQWTCAPLLAAGARC